MPSKTKRVGGGGGCQSGVAIVLLVVSIACAALIVAMIVRMVSVSRRRQRLDETYVDVDNSVSARDATAAFSTSGLGGSVPAQVGPTYSETSVPVPSHALSFFKLLRNDIRDPHRFRLIAVRLPADKAKEERARLEFHDADPYDSSTASGGMRMAYMNLVRIIDKSVPVAIRRENLPIGTDFIVLDYFSAEIRRKLLVRDRPDVLYIDVRGGRRLLRSLSDTAVDMAVSHAAANDGRGHFENDRVLYLELTDITQPYVLQANDVHDEPFPTRITPQIASMSSESVYKFVAVLSIGILAKATSSADAHQPRRSYWWPLPASFFTVRVPVYFDASSMRILEF